MLSNSAVYLSSNVINAAIPFALLPVLTRYLTPGEYGQVAIFQTFVGALGAVVGLNVAGAASRKYFDEDLAEGVLASFIGTCLQILTASALVAVALILLFAGPLSRAIGLDTEWMLMAVAVCTFSVVVQLRLGQWQVRQQPIGYAALQVGWSALNVAMSLLLVVLLHQGAEGRIHAQVAAVTIVALLALTHLRRDGLLPRPRWNPAQAREALRFGVPLVPHIAGMFLVSSVDRFVINAELGLASAGIYMVAVQLASGMGLVFDAVNSAYVPWLYQRLQRDRMDEKRQIVRYTYLWFALALLGAAAFFVAGPWLVATIAGPRYAEAGNIIGWLALGQAFGGMYLMVTNYVFYSKSTGLLAAATLTSGLTNIVLLYVFIRTLGLEGAAMAFACAMALRFLLTWWVAHRRHPMPWSAALAGSGASL